MLIFIEVFITVLFMASIIAGGWASGRPQFKIVLTRYYDPILERWIEGDVSYWYTTWIAFDMYKSYKDCRPHETVSIIPVRYRFLGLGKEIV